MHLRNHACDYRWRASIRAWRNFKNALANGEFWMKHEVIDAVAGCIMALAATAATAQQTAAPAAESAGGAALEELVVTAQRREENRQNGGIAVTAVTGRLMSDANAIKAR